MAQHPTYPHLLSEGRVKDMRTRNRIVMSSMCDNMADRQGRVTDQKIAYFRRRAEGGVGWINLGYAYVTRAGRGCTWFQAGIYDDELIPGMRRLTDAVHEYDVRMGCQIAHAGRQTTRHYVDGCEPEAPSAIAEPLLGEVPGELSRERIGEIVRELGDAARRAKEAGFDLVEFHGAHGYLHHAFVSLLSNKRSDEYGGPIENRLRFVRESVRAVREAVGDEFIVGYRLSGSEFLEGGITLEDTLATAAALEEEGIDYIHVSGGSYESVHMAVAPMWVGPGQLEPLAESVKRQVSVPVLSVGRYNHPDIAERVLADGHADFIVLGRALLADPDLPRKAEEGRAEEIRPCIACEQGCIDRWFSALDVTCIANPETGREMMSGWRGIRRVEQARTVLVVGGGPAGLEAARVATLEGHEVILWERQGEPGGQMALAARPPDCGAWRELLDWLLRQVEKAGGRVETGKEATRAAVLGLGADAVILATGSRPWIPREIPGWDLPHVMDPHRVLRGEGDVGERVVVYGGDVIGCQTALYLAAEGRQVTVLAHGKTDLFTDGMEEYATDVVGGIVRPHLLERLRQSVTLMPKRGIKRVVPEGVVTDNPGVFPPHIVSLRIGPVDEQLVEADTVVLGVERRPCDELYESLADEVEDLYPVGDANRPRTVYEAIAEGSAAARSVGRQPISPWMAAEAALPAG